MEPHIDADGKLPVSAVETLSWADLPPQVGLV